MVEREDVKLEFRNGEVMKSLLAKITASSMISKSTGFEP